MPQNVTETEAWTTPLTSVADGDSVNGATWLAAIQGYANRLKYISARLPGVVTGYEHILSPVPSHSNADWGPFSNTNNIDSSNVLLQVANGSPGGAPLVLVPVTLPNKGTLKSVTARVFGAWSSAVHAGLPATMPRLRMHRRVISTLVATQLFDIVDPSGTVGAYETAHDIAATGLSEALSNLNVYFLEIRGEAGTNALAKSFAVGSVKFVIDP